MGCRPHLPRAQMLPLPASMRPNEARGRHNETLHPTRHLSAVRMLRELWMNYCSSGRAVELFALSLRRTGTPNSQTLRPTFSEEIGPAVHPFRSPAIVISSGFRKR